MRPALSAILKKRLTNKRFICYIIGVQADILPWRNNMAHIYDGNAAAGACERNGQAHRNHEPDHNIPSTCFDKLAPWFIEMFSNELYNIGRIRAVFRPSLEPAL